MDSLSERIKKAPLGKTYLFFVGQAGYIIKNCDGRLLGIDLYLSDYVEKDEGHVGFHRLMPHILEPSEMVFDIIIATHFHRDHFDVAVMTELMRNGHTHLYCACDCRKDVMDLDIDESRVQYVKPGDVVQEAGFKLFFVNCDHGTGAPEAVGIIIETDGKRVLEVGDTCLHLDWGGEYLKEGVLDVLIAPINGAYGNLNEQDNVSLTKVLRPKISVPCHFGMFASHGGNPGLWKQLIEEQCPGQNYKFFTQGEGIEL